MRKLFLYLMICLTMLCLAQGVLGAAGSPMIGGKNSTNVTSIIVQDNTGNTHRGNILIEVNWTLGTGSEIGQGGLPNLTADLYVNGVNFSRHNSSYNNVTFQYNITSKDYPEVNFSVCVDDRLDNTNSSNCTHFSVGDHGTQYLTVQVNITCRSNITSNVSLVSNITCNKTDLDHIFRLQTSNITLDCNNYIIGSGNTSSGIIVDNFDYINIKNCEFRNTSVALNMTNSTGTNFTNNIIMNNTYRHKYNESDGTAEITDGTIKLIRCNNTVISGNNITLINASGINVADSYKLVIQSNVISGRGYQGTFGIKISSSSDNITITQNNITAVIKPISITDAVGANITSNTIRNNTADDTAADAVIELLRVNGSQIINNTLSKNEMSGIKLTTSPYTTIARNTLVGGMGTANTAGILAITNSHNLTITNLNNISSFSVGINASSLINVYIKHNQISNNSGNGGGIEFSHVNDSQIQNNTIYENHLGIYMVDSINNLISENTLLKNNFRGEYTGKGILLQSLNFGTNSSKNIIEYNNIYHHNISGIEINGTNNNISTNYFFNDTVGILILGNSTKISLINNNATNCTLAFNSTLNTTDSTWYLTERSGFINSNVILSGSIIYRGGSVGLIHSNLTLNGTTLALTGNITSFKVESHVNLSNETNIYFPGESVNITFWYTTPTNTTTVIVSKLSETEMPTSPSGKIAIQGADINIENKSKENFSQAYIRMYYTNASNSSLNLVQESTLEMYYYNETTSAWDQYPITIQGRNVQLSYVWANVSHLSTYGLFGIAPAAVTTGGGGSGGGGTCTPIWECTSWSPCLEGTQERTCTDSKNCGTIDKKPAEVQECEKCTEDWICSDWGDCISGYQTRTCEDWNACTTTALKPGITRTCTITDGQVVPGEMVEGEPPVTEPGAEALDLTQYLTTTNITAGAIILAIIIIVIILVTKPEILHKFKR